jgi:hypothetical protein
MKFKGYVHHASREAPQYLIKSDKTEHVAIHKGAALRLIPPRARKSSRTTGTDEAEETMTNDERMQRESSLIATVRRKLSEFAKACADDTELVLLHQDAFAADYQEDEYVLLGMAIKYAGLRGKEVRVIGRNRSSLGKENRIQ